jgi:hypothetical protein
MSIVSRQTVQSVQLGPRLAFLPGPAAQTLTMWCAHDADVAKSTPVQTIQEDHRG